MANVYAISGFKHTGKTTMVLRLIPILTAKGYKVATIKHDAHDWVWEKEGTDTERHFREGAYGTAIFSDNKFMIQKRSEEANVEMLIEQFPEADIILLEGFKYSKYPKYICNYPEEELMDAEELAAEILKTLGLE